MPSPPDCEWPLFFIFFSRTSPGFARFPSFEGERVLVHCADTNFEPRVGDGIEGIVNRRAKDNKLQAFKVFSYYYSSSLHPPLKPVWWERFF